MKNISHDLQREMYNQIQFWLEGQLYEKFIEIAWSLEYVGLFKI